MRERSFCTTSCLSFSIFGHHKMSSCTKTAGDVGNGGTFFRLNGGKLGGFHKQYVFFSGFHRNEVELAGLLRMLISFGPNSIWHVARVRPGQKRLWQHGVRGVLFEAQIYSRLLITRSMCHILVLLVLKISSQICIVPTIPLAVNLTRLWGQRKQGFEVALKNIQNPLDLFMCL